MITVYIGWEGKRRKEGVKADWSQHIWILYQRRKFGFYHLDKGKWSQVSKCWVDNVHRSIPLWRMEYIEEITKRVINSKSFSWVEAVERQSKQLVWDVVRTGEGDGTPLQYSCLENPMDGGAWWAAVCGVAKSRTRLSDFTFTFHFHALEKEMATHSSILAWRIPGTEDPGRRPSMGSHRVGDDWSDLAAAAYPYMVRVVY